MADQDDNTANDNTNHDDPNNSESYPVISAAAASSSSDEELAKRWQTLEQLTSIFGFPMHVAEQAIDAVGYTDATTCYNYILDHNLAPDSGGPIAPIDHCAHVEQHVQLSEADVLHVLQGKRPQDAPCSHVGAIDTKLPATKANNTIATPEQPKSATAGEEESSWLLLLVVQPRKIGCACTVVSCDAVAINTDTRPCIMKKAIIVSPSVFRTCPSGVILVKPTSSIPRNSDPFSRNWSDSSLRPFWK